MGCSEDMKVARRPPSGALTHAPTDHNLHRAILLVNITYSQGGGGHRSPRSGRRRKAGGRGIVVCQRHRWGACSWEVVDTERAAVPGLRQVRFRLHDGHMDNVFAFAEKNASFYGRFRLNGELMDDGVSVAVAAVVLESRVRARLPPLPWARPRKRSLSSRM